MNTHFSSKNFRYLYYVVPFVALILAAQAFGSAAPASSADVRIKNFGKVNDNYYRGAQPKNEDFGDLKALGVKTIIDLRNDKLDKAQGWASNAGLRYINIPLYTKRPASEEQTIQFLNIVNDPSNWPVFVHCKGGRHRTGEMTAVYRITKDGWSAKQAYEEMKKYDFENNFFYPRALKKFVFAYYERYTSQKIAPSGGSAPGALTTAPR